MAFAPAAAEAVAVRLVRELPAHLRLAVSEDDARFAVRLAAEAEECDPEAAVSRHITDATGAGAPEGFAAAMVAVRAAAASRDRTAFGAALAALATAACDVADPYLAGPAGESEASGARAWFSDAIASVAPESLAERGAYSPEAEGARALAVESSLLRERIAAAVLAADADSLTRLREGQLAAALSLARAALRAALPGEVTPARGQLRLAPEPLRGAVTLSLQIPGAGRATLEVFDVAGRRMLSHELGRLASGEQTIALSPAVFGALPSGVYLARVSAGGAVAETRATRLAD